MRTIADFAPLVLVVLRVLSEVKGSEEKGAGAAGSKAPDLAPANSSYKSAYDRLSRMLRQKSR